MNSNNRRDSLGRVAILMATYEGSQFIQQQVDSILSQTHTDFILYIRDDGSSDAFKQVLLDLVDSRSKIKLIDLDGARTGSAAENFFEMIKSINSCEFDYFMFADQDDIWLPDKISKCLYRLKNGYSGYSSNLTAFLNEDNAVTWSVDKYGIQTKYDYLFQGASAGCTYGISRDLFEIINSAIRSFPSVNYKGLSHDWLIYAIARSHGLGWYMDSNSYIMYRQHDSNVTGRRKGFPRLFDLYNKLTSPWYHNIIVGNLKYLNQNFEVQNIRSFFFNDSLPARLAILSKIFLYLRRSRVESLIIVPFLLLR